MPVIRKSTARKKKRSLRRPRKRPVRKFGRPMASLSLADDALAAFKRAAQALLDFPNELAQGVKWFATDFATERTKRAQQQKKAA